MGELLLGIDIGTASSKGLLARPDGEIVAVSERPHPLSLPRPGWAEHDAEEVWWADFRAICADLVSRADGRIVGVCTSGIGACLLPADSAGRPLRPAILYGIDTRATREIAELTERYGDAAILERGGTLLTSQAVGPKLLWLQRNEPEVWSRTRQLLMASSFLVQRLTGEYVLDHHSASQCDPLYDVNRNTWNEEWAAEIAPGLPLPRLVWPGEVAGRVTAEAALATGLPAGAPVAAGTIDAWAEALSVDVRAPGDLMLMYGSTMMLIEFVDTLRPYPGLWGTPGVFRGTSTLAAGMSTSGILTGWFKDLVHGSSFEGLVREAAAVPPGADGLVVLPYFAGERCPMADPLARGLICGLALHHGRGHLYRALLESTAYGVRHNIESLREAGATQRRVVAVGGGTRGGLWTQIVSDVIGRPQEIPRETIGASYGDALLAAIAAELVDPETRWNSTGDVVEPREESRDVYDTLYRVYRELYPSTREQMHVLAELQLAAAKNVRGE
jgi:xylulokinase